MWFIHPQVQQIFVGHLLCARPCTQHSSQRQATPCPGGAYILVVRAAIVVREWLDLGIYFWWGTPSRLPPGEQ